MASLTLGIVGNVVGGIFGGPIGAEIGGFIGASLGSLIDNQLFPNKQQGPRLTDLSVQTSTYGNAITLLFGPENRVTGNVIFSTGLIETSHETSSKGGPTVNTTNFTYSATFAVAFADCSKRGPIRRIKKIWANKKLIFDVDVSSGPVSGAASGDEHHGDGIIGGFVEGVFNMAGSQNVALWTSLNFYPGSFSQNPDPVMEGLLGVGEVPAYRGTAYCVIENFQLADYGNRLPQLEFLVEADEGISAGGILDIICDLCGVDPLTISTSSIDGLVRGYAIGTNSSGTGAIQPLALAYNFDTAQVGGGLRFQARGSSPAGTIRSDMLGGHQSDQDRPSVLQWNHQPEALLPREVTITFPDPDRDYQPNSQTARRQAGSADSNLVTQLPIVVDADTARQLADRMLWERWSSRSTATSQTDDRLIGLEAARVYVFETPGGLEPLRVTSMTRGANGVIELELARDRAAVYQSSALGISAPTPPQIVNVPGPSFLQLLDCPILQDKDDDTGFYYLVDGDSEDFRGADVLRSTDFGATYDEVAGVGLETVIGTIDSLAAGPTEVFDNLNVVRVTLYDPDDTLESVTELDVLNGKNACWIGPPDGRNGEIAQFKTATLVSPGIYDLSGWLRGRLGTEYAVGRHDDGESFILLQAGPLRRADFSAADWNKERVFKAVSLLTTIDEADPVEFINTGEGKRPLSPVHIAATTAAGDTTITWLRRSRYRQPGLGGGPLALGEAFEAYEVDIVVSSAVLRTLTTASPEVVYDAAAQLADGVGPGDTVQIAVYQMSDVRGRGRPGVAEVLL